MSKLPLHWRLDADVGREPTPELLAAFIRVLDEHEPALVLCDVGGVERPGMATLNALARLSLAAKRRDCRLRLTGVTPRLWTLLRLTGLDETLI